MKIKKQKLKLLETLETSQKTNSRCFHLNYFGEDIMSINNSCYDENDLIIYDNWEFETNLNLTEKDKEIIKKFCEKQDKE